MRNMLIFLLAVMVSPLLVAVPVPGPGEAGTQRYTSLTNPKKKVSSIIFILSAWGD